MSFSGDLRGIGLSDVFQNVAANRTTGTLCVRARRDERYVRFETGAIAGLSLGVGKGLSMLDHLRTRGYVDSAALDRVLSRGRRSRKPPTLLCTEARLLDDDTLRAAIAERVEECLYDLFNLKEAEFTFEEGEPPARVFDSEQSRVGLRLEIGPLLMEAARRRDEMERIQKVVAGDQEIFVLLEGWEELVADDLGAVVAPLLDGRRTVAAVEAEVTVSPFHVRKSIYDLVQAGAARPSTAEELAQTAESVLQEGAVEDALLVMARALELARSDDELRTRYAELLESAGRKADAAVEHARLGSEAERRGEHPEALAAYDRAVGLSPDDLALREKRVELLELCAPDDDLVSGVLELVERHRSMGLADRARTLLARVVEARRLQQREDVVTMLARVESSLGHWQESARIYRRLGESLLRTDEARGLGYLREALDQDPQDVELRCRVEEIETGRERRRRVFRRRVAGIAASVAVVGSLGFVGVAELTASRRVAFALGSGLGGLREGEGVVALSTLENVGASYGWTPTGHRIPAWIDRLVDLQLEAVRERIVDADFDAAERICEELRGRVDRPDLEVTCAALLARIGRERDAYALLQRIERQQRRPTAVDLEQLDALGEPDHLDFLLAHVTDVRDHEARAAMLGALARIDSPRAYPVVARLLLQVRDDASIMAARSVLRSAAVHRGEGREPEWMDVYPELERALGDPDRASIAREILVTLRGGSSG